MPVAAIVGGAGPSDGADLGRHVVLIVGSKGTSCSGVAIAKDLILTAAHCSMPGAVYKFVAFDTAHRPSLRDVADIARHPDFSLGSLLGHRATADVALLKLADSLPIDREPATIADRVTPIEPGERFTVAGYGVAVRGDGRTGGTVRLATLAATGWPGSLQLRLIDPATGGATPGLGACTGDSGAPVFQNEEPFAVIGIVSWSTGPAGSDGCGGLTGVTPLSHYRDWIIEAARRLGSTVGP